MSFKVGTSQSTEVSQPVAEHNETTAKADVEIPFSEYMNTNHRPLTADYFEAPMVWDEGVMVDDITSIEDYLKSLVETGELENSVKAAKEKLKSLEKMANIDKLESKANRTVQLAEFVKYLARLEEKKNAKYF